MSSERTGPPLRVVVVDDHKLFRQALAELLKADGRVSVVGTAEDGDIAVKKVAALLPNVVLMDVHMARMDGIRAAARIARAHPSVHVLMLASVQDDRSVVEAMRAGAVGFVQKDMSCDELVEAIFRAAAGRPVLSTGGQRAVVAAALNKVEVEKPPAGLTARQFQVLRLMSTGLGFKQIARELGVAEKTVRNQASRIYAKLKVHDRAEAMLFALHKGFAT